ncbi:MAG TPA: glycosyltransferase [Patescibacteria group bacterium]|nr:glycosyltransferase [Patescibacteria group bacterium]
MEALSKTHLRVNNKHWLIKHPAIQKAGKDFASSLAKEAENLPEDFLLAPVIFSPDKQIFFHGGDFLPFTHLPMPWAGNELWIGQYPETREVGFIPLFAFLIPDHLYKKLKPPPSFGDNIVEHGEFVMRAKELGVKCFVTPKVHCLYPYAYNPEMGKEKFKKVVTKGLEEFDKKWKDKIERKQRFPVVVQTIISQAGGYNIHAYNFCKELFEAGIQVYYHFIGGTNEDEGESGCAFIDDFKTRYGSMRLPQITLCHGTNNFKNSGDYKIAFSTTEVDGIPHEWVECFNEMDEVWVTSEFVKKSFVSSGVKKPVYVIYEGVDPNYFHPGISPFANPPKESFKFMSNFAWGRRKGVDVLFEAFRKEFSEDEDVSFILKALPSYFGHKIKDELDLVYNRKGAAKVYLYDIELQKYELGRIYRMADCFVWPTRGEGFGLPPIEALACGLPVIASDHSSHMEFLKKDGKPLPGVLPLEGKLAKYDKGDSIYYPGFNWFNPSVSHLRKLMRYAFENKDKLKKEALISSEYIRKNWNWGISTQTVVERLEEIYKKRWKTS